MDFVVNHTSLDSKLLAENPDYFIGFRYDGPCPEDGYFGSYWNGGKYCVHNGGFEYGNGISTWIDTAQVNYSNRALRDRMTAIVRDWVTKFDVDGFRVDMAYLALNNVFARTWRKSMPREEFYRQLIWTVKAQPSAAFMAEAYASRKTSGPAAGLSGNRRTPGRANRRYNATEAAPPGQGLERAAFLAWQTAGRAPSCSSATDEPARKIYGAAPRRGADLLYRAP